MKIKLIVLLMIVWDLNDCFAQTIITEDDGFKWMRFQNEKFMGAKDENGNVLIPASESIGFNWISYDHGYLCGVNTDINEWNDDLAKMKNIIGYYSKNGKCIIAPKKYDHVSLQTDDDGKKPPYYIIMKNGLWGACDIDGQEILSPSSYSFPQYEDAGFEIKDASGEYVQTGIKLRGHDNIKMADKRSYLESDGYEWVRLCNSDRKYGAMTHSGSLIFPIEYDRIEYKPSRIVGKTGLFVLRKGDAKGWYSAQGYCFVPVEMGYTYIRLCNYDNYVRVDKGDKEYGIFHTDLGEIIPPGKYSYVGLDKDGFFSVEKNNKYGAVDLYGNELVAPIYDNMLSVGDEGIYYTNDNLDDVYVYYFPVEEDDKAEDEVAEEISAQSQSGILDNLLNLFSSVAEGVSNINAVTAQNNYENNKTTHRKTHGIRRASAKKTNSVASTTNERNDRNTYNSYVSQLIDMNTYRNRYDDSQRRRIQSSMKSIRSKYNFPKSDWEDWDGSPR